MKNKIVWIGGLSLLLLVAPGAAEAQQADGWWEWALRDVVRQDRDGGITLPRRPTIPGDDDRREDRRADQRDDDRYEDRDDDGRRGKGPKFCRNGEGHPVHGREWCRDKGFGVGSGSIRWEDRGWEDIILGAPRGGERRRDSVDRGGLIDVLGDIIYGRFDAERRRLGGSEPLVGRWLSPQDGARVLQIRSGSIPVAELSDTNGDGRVDAVLVPRR